MTAQSAANPAEALQDFVSLHQAALEANEARHTLILGMLAAFAANGAPKGLQVWTLGGPGQCAMRMPGRPIALGDLDAAQCRALAALTQADGYPGVVGPDLTAQWFAEAAAAHGAMFDEPMPQMIHALADPPIYPGAPGEPRTAIAEDLPRIFEWLNCFHREAVPHDLPPNPERLALSLEEGRYLLWCVDGEPVSVAAIGRRTRQTASIAPVYTPVELRGRGYAGSVVAALVDLAYAHGKKAVCLYTDLRNPSSNRCYAKIGFKPVCASRHYPRMPTAENA